MKLHVLLLSFFLLGASAVTRAQYESVFGANETSWNILTEEMAGRFLDSLVACCDTTVNGYDYKLIQKYQYIENWNTWQLEPADYGVLREDTTTGEAWYLSLADHVERKVSDMTLAVGDSFAVYNLNTSGFDSVAVDSVYYINGRKYIRLDIVPFYHYGDEEEKVKLIEGVGPNIGIYYGDVQFAIHAPYLLCAHKDGQQVYQNSNGEYGGYCSINVLNSTYDLDQMKSAIKSYPNPFSESITLEYEGEKYIGATTITIYNVKGQRVMTEQWTSGASKTIATVALPAGFYFMLLRKTNGALLFHSTLVKQ